MSVQTLFENITTGDLNSKVSDPSPKIRPEVNSYIFDKFAKPNVTPPSEASEASEGTEDSETKQPRLDIPEFDKNPNMKRYETRGAEIVKINCGGKMFITTAHSLSHYPDTLLGDKTRRDAFYRKELGCLYFNRDQDLFSSILYFYQSPGIFRPPENRDLAEMEEEMEYFDIKLEKMVADAEAILNPEEDKLPPTKLELMALTLNDPTTNMVATVWSAMDMGCILTSICMLVIESMPPYAHHFKNDFDNIIPLNMAIYGMDVFINVFFTTDVVLRFIAEPGKLAFVKNPLFTLDLMAIAPFYIEILMILFGSSGEGASAYLALKVCRVVRVVRVMKVARHSKQLGEVMEVVGGATREFVMLTGVVCLVVLLFGTIMYYVEGPHWQTPDTYNHTLGEDHPHNHMIPSKFTSIPAGCWWAIVTITSVGYGDLSPLTTTGRIIGSLVVFSGIVIMAFPMTIIISKFQESFTSRKMAENQEQTRKLRVAAETGHYPIYMVDKEESKLEDTEWLNGNGYMRADIISP